jgi:4-amino-4-deoxy-L-arabinose transferase-like glycosyltransferase
VNFATRRSFFVGLLLVCLLGLAIRLTYVANHRMEDGSPAGTSASTSMNILGGDAVYYHFGANALVDGRGFIDPILFRNTGQVRQSAAHPPLYMVYLAGASLLGARTVLAHQLASVLLGTFAVFLIGLLGRRLAGPRAGILAALIAAVYVNIWINDAHVLSETMAIAVVAATLLAVYRYLDRPSVLNIVLVGAGIGLLMLTRGELMLALPLLVPYVALKVSASWKQALKHCVALVAVSAVVVAPWLIRNRIEFAEPVTVTTSAGRLLSYANCEFTYSGRTAGSWWLPCSGESPNSGDESVDDLVFRGRATAYIRSHLTEVPRVVAIRVLRQWGLYNPFQQVGEDAVVGGRERPLGDVALLQFYVLAVMSVFGAIELGKRKVPLWPLISMVVLVTITAALSYGVTRFRTPAEVALVVLAAVAIDSALGARPSRSLGKTAEVDERTEHADNSAIHS